MADLHIYLTVTAHFPLFGKGIIFESPSIIANNCHL